MPWYGIVLLVCLIIGPFDALYLHIRGQRRREAARRERTASEEVQGGVWRRLDMRQGLWYRTAEAYTMKDLVLALQAAGAEVRRVEYEEDADPGMRYWGGSVSPEAFCEDYDALRRRGMGGMDYEAHASYRGAAFLAGMADDAQGRSLRVVGFRFDEKDRSAVEALIRRMGRDPATGASLSGREDP